MHRPAAWSHATLADRAHALYCGHPSEVSTLSRPSACYTSVSSVVLRSSSLEPQPPAWYCCPDRYSCFVRAGECNSAAVGSPVQSSVHCCQMSRPADCHPGIRSHCCRPARPRCCRPKVEDHPVNCPRCCCPRVEDHPVNCHRCCRPRVEDHPVNCHCCCCPEVEDHPVNCHRCFPPRVEDHPAIHHRCYHLQNIHLLC